MHILYLAQRVPYPPDRGDKIITFHQVQHLSRNHDVTVVCLAQDAADLENARKLASQVHRVHAVRLSPLRARLRAAAALLGGKPFTLGYFNEPGVGRAVRELLARGSMDAAVAFCSGMAQFVEDAVGLPRVIHMMDLDSMKWKQYAEAVRTPDRWLYAIEARRLLEYERRLAERFDHCFVTTESELCDLRRLVGAARASCLPNGVDLDYFHPSPDAPEPDSLVFTGVMDYKPNVEGAAWFCREVLPAIRQQVPQVRLTICGARPVRSVRRLASLPGVTVTGRVPDVRPYLWHASAAVVPLRIARGIQNKVIEAMAAGRAVVATPRALQGIRAVAGEDVLRANDAEEFAAQVVRVLRDPGLRERLGRAARASVERNYRWDVPLSQLEATLRSLVEERSKGRPAGCRADQLSEV